MEAVMNDIKHTGFDTADITALSHLYRGEVYRSTVWRTRLDTTFNVKLRGENAYPGGIAAGPH
jgi:uncharacterized membrane protein